MTQLNNILEGRIWSRRVFFALFLILSGQAFAALPLATIQDVIFNADGTRFNGVASVEWKSFQASDGSIVAAQSVSVTIVNGNLRVRLVPTANASAGAKYTVRYSSGGRILFTEYWSVPVSTVVLKLRDVRSTATGQLLGSATTVEIADVGGLQDELDSRPVKGFGFAPNRVMVAGATGALEAASGSLTDCVHVDGTAGPCGSSGSTGSSGPGFVDFEVPAGPVNGTNTSFSLAQAPSPSSSLQLFRNGIVLKQGLDYTLSGNVLSFSSGSIPRLDDIIAASYRLATAGQVSILQNGTLVVPQVICSAPGSTSSSNLPTVIGTCTIPSNVLQVGDRVEIHYGVAHAGNSSITSLTLKWGDSVLATQSLVALEAAAVGKISLSLSASSGLYATQLWGGRSAQVSSAGLIQSSVGQLTPITLEAQVPGQGTDSVMLQNFSVIRYPNTMVP